MTAWHSSSFDVAHYELIEKSYSQTMIVLAFVIALLTTYLCMSVVENSWHDKQSRSLRRWQAYSSTLFSIGGWGCFYLGILALQLPIDSEFHIEYILLSLVPALVGGWIGFGILKSLSFTLSEVVLSAFSFTCGLAAMMLVAHWALDIDGQVVFYPKLLFWSFVPTFLLCGISLFLVKLHHRTKSIDRVRRVVISSLFGLAIFSFPYTVLQSIDVYHREEVNGMPHVPLYAMTVMALLILSILATLIVGHKLFYRVGSVTPITVEDDEDVRWKKEKNIIDGFSDGVVIVDPEGGISHMNEAAKTLFAYGETDTLPLSINELMPDFQLNRTLYPTQTAADNGLSQQTSVKACTGDSIACEFTVTPVAHRQEGCFYIVLRRLQHTSE